MAFFLTVLFSLSGLYGEEAPVSPAAAESVPAGEEMFLPLAPLLEVLSLGDVFWRPDWPEAFPPDAFSLNAGRVLSIGLRAGDETMTLRRDTEGRLREFPLFWKGAFVQVQAAYDASGRFQRLSAGTSPEDSFTVEFPEDFLSPGGDPVRVNLGGTWYFVVVLEAGPALSETWYDEEGNLTAWYQAHIRREGPVWRIRSLESRAGGERGREDYGFDNNGHVTEVRSPAGEFTAQYRYGRPVYWDRTPAAKPAPAKPGTENAAGTPPPGTPSPAGIPPAGTPGGAGRFALQWDERGLLTAKGPRTEETEGKFRYEYETGGRGDWTRRQDFEMISRNGMAFPLFLGQYERQIGYWEE